jgi:hypothetical protein
MTAPVQPTPAAPVAPAVEFQAPAAAVPDPTANPAPNEALDDDNLDDRAKKVIEAIRNDFKSERSKRQAAEEAARQAPIDLAQTIGKALGLVADDAPVDPAKLTEQLTVEQANARQAKVELAVFRAAPAAKGDPAALLDSLAFQAKVKDLDPNDSAAIAAAITTAVAENPKLGVQTTSGIPAPNPANGSSANGSEPDYDSQIAAAQKAGNFALAISLKRQRQYATKT